MNFLDRFPLHLVISESQISGHSTLFHFVFVHYSGCCYFLYLTNVVPSLLSVDRGIDVAQHPTEEPFVNINALFNVRIVENISPPVNEQEISVDEDSKNVGYGAQRQSMYPGG
jgi:hypothetical protein